MRVEKLPLDSIKPPDNRHRIEFEEGELRALAASIANVGLINPITVKEVGQGRYEVVAGHRRWRAMHLNGEAYIDAVISQDDSMQTERLKFAENNIRADLTPMEEAIALNQMLADEGVTMEMLAGQVSRTLRWVENRIALLDYPEDLQKAVHGSVVSLAAATELAMVTDDNHREYLMQYAIESGAAAGVMKQWRVSWQQSVAANPNAEAPKPPMGEAGQTPNILIPCAICTNPTDHMQTMVMRACKPCYHELMAQLRGTKASA